MVALIAKTGKPMKLSLTLTGRTTPNMPSGNVIADLAGRDPTLPKIIVACHLDSWDIGMGVIDDGAGIENPTDGGGNGLRGMYERVTSMGGTLTAGPRAGRPGFRVTATIPVHGNANRPLPRRS